MELIEEKYLVQNALSLSMGCDRFSSFCAERTLTVLASVQLMRSKFRSGLIRHLLTADKVYSKAFRPVCGLLWLDRGVSQEIIFESLALAGNLGQKNAKSRANAGFCQFRRNRYVFRAPASCVPPPIRLKRHALIKSAETAKQT